TAPAHTCSSPERSSPPESETHPGWDLSRTRGTDTRPPTRSARHKNRAPESSVANYFGSARRAFPQSEARIAAHSSAERETEENASPIRSPARRSDRKST